MGRIYCPDCGRVGCENDDRHANKYGYCDCGGTLELQHNGNGTYYAECNECDVVIEDVEEVYYE